MVLAINRLAIGCHLIEVGIKNQMTVEYHPNLPATSLNFLLIPLSDRLEVFALTSPVLVLAHPLVIWDADELEGIVLLEKRSLNAATT